MFATTVKALCFAFAACAVGVPAAAQAPQPDTIVLDLADAHEPPPEVKPWKVRLTLPAGWEADSEPGSAYAALTKPFRRECHLLVAVGVAPGNEIPLFLESLALGRLKLMDRIAGTATTPDGQTTATHATRWAAPGGLAWGVGGGSVGPGGKLDLRIAAGPAGSPKLRVIALGGTEGIGCLIRSTKGARQQVRDLLGALDDAVALER